MPCTLAEIDAYKAYLTGVENRSLTLPVITKDNTNIVIHVDKLFCRVQYCRCPCKAFPGTNDLRYHIKSAYGIDIRPATTGRPSSCVVKEAIHKYFYSFYEAVVNGMEVLEDPPLPNRSTPIPEPLLQLPLTRTKNPSSKKIKEMLAEIGVNTCPCLSCKAAGKKASACCKDRTICDHFSFFNCSEIDGDNKDNGEKEDTSI
ncbi:uncharacterized protein ATNIH1004_006645 [Aspergillus tanneri]|uniref:Uncharacterized protein n=1 Tax=Aspergillus tanneri TaxID=1220188 RepID=A0A5M9MHE2_9EURO|nr:uncharacterized protein ATNIH1004_006645 [Aspergillus tanneri]KAA8645226.1 hypothetical protein ATNIH1004_006645 [Aspergillus tanneri]